VAQRTCILSARSPRATHLHFAAQRAGREYI
jgi:hypothetical protein